MAGDAIFIHSSWRAASTYVWSKFRARPETYCYFEPLNEHLPTATHDFIDWFRPWAFAHHPPLEAPYLEEFRPLLRPSGGIASFPEPLIYGHYCADGGTALPGLEAYLDDLAALAARLGRRPVYGFVRTDLRVGWFRANRPGAHVFVRRDPRRQFLSVLGQAAKGTPFFLQRGLIILLHNLDSPVLAPLLARVDVLALAQSVELHDVFKGRLDHGPTLHQLYLIFYFLRRAAGPLGEAQCDLVIDIDRMTLEPSYRGRIETGLADLVGMDISFADCRVERYEANLDWSQGFFDRLEREVEGIEPAIAACATGGAACEGSSPGRPT